MQKQLFINVHMDQPEYHTATRGQVGVFTSQSPDRSHERNEDSAALFTIDDDRAVLALADGAGGVRGGDIASAMAIRQLQVELERGLHEERGLRGCILDAFENANQAIIEHGVGAATTLAVIEIDAGTIRSYHAGDSAVIAVGQRGKCKLQTMAHSPVGYAVESGVIDMQDAMQHDDRHLISNFVGAPAMHIEVGPPLKLARRDTVLIASDGLTDNLHNGEIIESIRKGSLDRVMERVITAVRQRMESPGGEQPSKPDDLTFMIFRRTE
jgi:serine/threonine protein phosphatase PrpC